MNFYLNLFLETFEEERFLYKKNVFYTLVYMILYSKHLFYWYKMTYYKFETRLL